MNETPAPLRKTPRPKRPTIRDLLILTVAVTAAGVAGLLSSVYTQQDFAGAVTAPPAAWHASHARQRRDLFPELQPRRWLKHRHVLDADRPHATEPMPPHHLDRG